MAEAAVPPVPPRKRKVFRRCCAPNCLSEKHLFAWPKERGHFDAWTSFVKQKERDFSYVSSKRICCKHFKEDCFDNLYAYAIGVENM